MTTEQVGIGDVIVTRSERSFFGRVIRIGAALQDEAAEWNHCIVLVHQDRTGRWHGVEGRPGGSGWTDCTDVLADRWTLSNAAQPKTETQRADLAGTMRDILLGLSYDHVGIASNVVHALGLGQLWQAREWEGQVPQRIVCSSGADLAMERVGLANPGGNGITRRTKPADFARFILRREWETA